MLAKRARRLWIALPILLLASLLRLYRVTYGYDEPCLSVAEENWLYDYPQPSSLYAWDYRPNLDEGSVPDPFVRTVAPDAETLLLMRMGGALAGLITIALMLRLGLSLGANWWWLAGLAVAALPWFANADRWLVRFDPAPLAVAVSALALLSLYQRPTGDRLRVWIQSAAALCLLLVAPPLWWLAAGLLALQPRFDWRPAALMLIVGVTAVPALQSPASWLQAAQSWDTGATAACIWVVVALGLWRWRRLPGRVQAAVGLIILVAGGLSFQGTQNLPTPTANEWKLIAWLQERVPDGAVVRFDQHTWPLAPVVACPERAKLRFTAQPEPVEMPYLPGVRASLPPPDFIVTRGPQVQDEGTYVFRFDGNLYVKRATPLPAPSDIRFGNLFYVVSYQLRTPTVAPSELADIRLDYQFGSSVTTDALRYAVFIHIVSERDPGNRIVNYNVPLAEEISNFGPRRYAFNQHYRISIPANAEPGTYHVVFGIFNIYTGERLSWSQGDSLLIGKLEIVRR
jgi:hypothetical protein